MVKQTITEAAAWAALIDTLVNPTVSVKSPNGRIVQCDLRKVPAAVGKLFIAGYVEKRLADISKNSTKGGTENDVHDQRQKVVQTWYGGDFSMKGGGTADPVAVQMKEEIISVYIKHGLAPNAARKHVKGTAVQFLTEQSKLQSDDADEQAAWLRDKVDEYRAAAETTLAERGKVDIKIDPAKIKL